MTSGAPGWFGRTIAIASAVTVAYLLVSAVAGRAYVGLPAGQPDSGRSAFEYDIESPHGQTPECAACHRAHSAVDEDLLLADNSQGGICTQCHYALGEEPKSTHSNIHFAAATEYGFSTTCTACHDPHADPDAESGNKAMIQTSIAGHTVRFNYDTGPDSFDDGWDDGEIDSICAVCHTSTAYSNVYSGEIMGQGHGPVGSDCTQCHSHGDDPGWLAAFMAEPTATPVPDTPTSTPTLPPTDTPEPPPTDTPGPPPSETPTSTPTETPPGG